MTTHWGHTGIILLELLAALSLVTFIVSLLCIPVLVARLPRDYFHPARQSPPRYSSRAMQVFILVVRNLLGGLLLVAGIAMLFLPGQGIITIIVAIALMRFPWKRQVLVRATQPASVRRGLDWIRKKVGKEPFSWQPHLREGSNGENGR